MANWNLPTINSNYVTFVDELNTKIVDAGTIGFGSPINLPDHAIRFNRSTNIFEEWNLTTWTPKVIGVAGGGTGATDANTIRTNLGLGSMSTQNSNAVNITGGSITGVAFSASDITGGIIALARGGTGASLTGTNFGDVLLWNGGQIVLAPGVNLRSFDASYLTQGTVPAARLSGVAMLAANQDFTGGNSFSSGSIIVVGGYPSYFMYHSSAGVNLKRLSTLNYNGDFYVQRYNDDTSLAANLVQLTSSGVLNVNGYGVHTIQGANIAYGMINPAVMGAGAANSSTFLRGDGVWAPVAGGAAPTPIPSGMIAIFTTGCPAGWTRQSALDNRFPMGSTGWGSAGGTTSHYHDLPTLVTDNSGNHTHGVSGNTGNPSNSQNIPSGSFVSYQTGRDDHKHSFSVTSDGGGSHTHAIVNGRTNSEGNIIPPYLTVVFCQKD